MASSSTLRIAWRNLGRNRKRSALAFGAIAFGQFAFLAVAALVGGYGEQFLDSLQDLERQNAAYAIEVEILRQEVERSKRRLVEAERAAQEASASAHNTTEVESDPRVATRGVLVSIESGAWDAWADQRKSLSGVHLMPVV